MEFIFPWREAGPRNHLDDRVDSASGGVGTRVLALALKGGATVHDQVLC